MNDDVAGDLVNDQECHVIRYEIISGQALDVAFAVGDACPYGKINNGGDQPEQKVHHQIGAVLPLFSPVH
jgi:hypothetical protein